ncbi:MAG: 2-oxoacid:acceptor oxidoreductase family protein [Acholeplasmataceae bacterium]|nr:2-oxoacid:acceptor oxidoreductase family protein [Acholeplasmataceae bacterium]
MIRTIRIAGFGGQGVMLTGQLLAHAATKQGLHSLWVPTYGPETRGGTANCAVTVSDQPIYSPVFKNSDDLLVFNGPSLDKFGEFISQDGHLFYNSSLIDEPKTRDDVHAHGIPMNEIAIGLDVPQVANMVMLGAYVKMVKIFDEDVVLSVLAELLGDKKKHLLEVNRQAMDEGKACL